MNKIFIIFILLTHFLGSQNSMASQLETEDECAEKNEEYITQLRELAGTHPENMQSVLDQLCDALRGKEIPSKVLALFHELEYGTAQWFRYFLMTFGEANEKTLSLYTGYEFGSTNSKYCDECLINGVNGGEDEDNDNSMTIEKGLQKKTFRFADLDIVDAMILFSINIGPKNVIFAETGQIKEITIEGPSKKCLIINENYTIDDYLCSECSNPRHYYENYTSVYVVE